MKVISYDEAREYGMIAYENDADPNSNPFKQGTHAHIGWDDGYDYAKFMTETEQ